MSAARFEQVDDRVEIVEMVGLTVDDDKVEVRVTVFTFDPETRPEARTRIVAVLNANLAELSRP